MFTKLFKSNKKLWLVLLLVIPLVFFFLNNRSMTEQEFWSWYSENSDRYYEELANERTEFLPEVGDKLEMVDKNLTFQFGLPDPKTKKAELVISADGIREGIPAVQKIVNSAPKYDKWNIIAFRQRVEDFDEIEFEGIRLSREDIFFKAKDEGEKTGVDFFIKGYDGADQRYIGAMFILLDNTLGEYDVMTRIGTIEIHTLDEGNMDGLKLLIELRKVIDVKNNMFSKLF